jgi:hypothetical protein
VVHVAAACCVQQPRMCILPDVLVEDAARSSCGGGSSGTAGHNILIFTTVETMQHSNRRQAETTYPCMHGCVRMQGCACKQGWQQCCFLLMQRPKPCQGTEDHCSVPTGLAATRHAEYSLCIAACCSCHPLLFNVLSALLQCRPPLFDIPQCCCHTVPRTLTFQQCKAHEARHLLEV